MSATSQTDNHGLVRPWERGRSFELERFAPSPELERIVERHWIARWDLRGREPFRQETLPHPSINLVVEPDGTWIWGVPTKRDTRILQGEGWAVGTKFRAGAFTACTGIDASSVTDSRLSIDAGFAHSLEAIALIDAHNAASKSIVAATEALLAPLAIIDEPALDLVAEIIDGMCQLAPDARVEDIAAIHYLAPRTLQRLFRRYVGVSPKWVLKRMRIHQAVEELVAHSPRDVTELALRLGYYDYAHFVRDFRLVVGRSPAKYAAEAALALQR